MLITTGYTLELAGLREAVAHCTPDGKHQKLLLLLRAQDTLASVQFRTQRGDRYLHRYKVLDMHGRLVHDDHQAWLAAQLAVDDGLAPVTYERLKGLGYLLSKVHLTQLYFVEDQDSADASDFVQVEVELREEYSDRTLFTQWPHTTPRDLRDLANLAGEELPVETRIRIGTPYYALQRVVDMRAFVQEAVALEQSRRAAFRKRRFAVQADDQPVRVLPAAEAFPDWDAAPVKWARLFADWALSSAGRSGARLGEHWVMQISDYTGPQGGRSMTLIPLWCTTLKLAQIEGSKGGVYELYGKLEKLDQRVKVPFAWYFFMLHGNRVDDAAARRVVAAAEAGQIVLPEHDYQILRGWHEHPYGF